jgi:hypothetical protein
MMLPNGGLPRSPAQRVADLLRALHSPALDGGLVAAKTVALAKNLAHRAGLWAVFDHMHDELELRSAIRTWEMAGSAIAADEQQKLDP